VFKNTPTHYGSVAMLLHWGMAVLIVGLLILGLIMTGLPIGIQKLKFYRWHKELGVLVLMLVTVRICWRMINTTPPLPASIPRLQQLAAHVAHYAFYVFMMAMPITGWMLSSAAGLPVSFFDLFVLPDLVSADPSLKELLTKIHQWLAYGLILTLCAHVGAALLHHFINKDDILRRILP